MADSAVPSGSLDGLADPIHLQKLYKSLRLNPLLDYVESVINRPISDSDDDSEDEVDYTQIRHWNSETSLYNLSGVQKKRRWVCDAIGHSSDSDSLSDSSYTYPGHADKQWSDADRQWWHGGAEAGSGQQWAGGGGYADDARNGGMVKIEPDNADSSGHDDDEESDDELLETGNKVKMVGFTEERQSKKFKSDDYSKQLMYAKGRTVGSVDSDLEVNRYGESRIRTEQVTLTKMRTDQIFNDGNYDSDNENNTEKVTLDYNSQTSSNKNTEYKADGQDNSSESEDEDATDDSDESDERTEESDDETDDSDSREKETPVHESLTMADQHNTAGAVSPTRASNINRINAMLREHVLRKTYANEYYNEEWNKDPDGLPVGSSNGCAAKGDPPTEFRGRSFMYYGAGLLSNMDRYSDHQRFLACARRCRSAPRPRSGGSGVAGGGRKLLVLEQAAAAVKEEELDDDASMDQNTDSLLSFTADGDESLLDGSGDFSKIRTRGPNRKEKKGKKLDAQALAVRRHKLWLVMARKEVVRSQRTRAAQHKEQLHNCKRLAAAATKTYKQKALQSQKVVKDKLWLLKRLSRSMQVEWKKFDRIVKEQNKRAEREAEEQRKMDKEIMEAKRQQRKVNFLITLPELYAHFMKNKIGEGGGDTSSILRQLEDPGQAASVAADDYDSEAMKAQALQTAQDAVRSQQSLLTRFDSKPPSMRGGATSSGGAPTADREREYAQPDVFMGQLKSYQLKGMNWIANLYYFGINGILADEMGLGKTVQAIAFLGHICEEYDTWGPFLIVTPASTLHNWTAEINRFTPEFKVVPYWGTPEERKSLRKFFDAKNDGDRTKSSFHIVVTSYHIVIQDFKFLNRLKWNYMVLDEAQAIKSINSQRWKLLLGFSCRNRLLLSGTPIQNTMAELWALLHFIMPALFDSHQWFNEWFSKDIEGHAENRTHVDEKHLNRLHTILKPFMLRRIKTEVENELTDKIEIMVYCPLTLRQKFLYSGLKNKISIDELLHSTSGTATAQSSVTTTLMNLVMQFRKVCNHPELLERREVQSPLLVSPDVTLIPRLVYYLTLTNTLQHYYNRVSPFVSWRIHQQLYGGAENRTSHSNSWGFAALCGLSVGETSAVLRDDLPARLLLLHCRLQRGDAILRHRQLWVDDLSVDKCADVREADSGMRTRDTAGDTCTRDNTCDTRVRLDNVQCRTIPSITNRGRLKIVLVPRQDYSSEILKSLVFCSYTSSFYKFSEHVVHSMPETLTHRTMRLNKLKKPKIEEIVAPAVEEYSHQLQESPECVADTAAPTAVPQDTSVQGVATTPPGSTRDRSPPNKQESPVLSPKKYIKLKTPIKTDISKGSCDDSNNPAPLPLPYLLRPTISLPCQHTTLPPFLAYTRPKVVCTRRRLYCYDPRTRMWERDCVEQHGGVGLSMLQEGAQVEDGQRSSSCSLQCAERGGLEAFAAKADFNKVIIPDKHSLMMDAGKLFVLDSLLCRMKAAGNRVLIYSQMTKMINLLEEYMRHRHHKYMRLDGSSKISDRRDMVADFQSKSDIFVFLLSTRAGGVGINLTAADTVIFYDSDWNPTVDQQAMDRAHRVGQTKQVTVYRLICKGTIEERILQRAKEKSEIQRMVISGGNFKPDTLKPKEVVSLLLDDDIEQQFRARQDDRRAMDEQRVEYNREKMRKRYAEKKREQQEVKRRRLDEDATVDVCGSPSRSTSPPSDGEERCQVAPGVPAPSPHGGVEPSSSNVFPPLLDDSPAPPASAPQSQTSSASATPPALQKALPSTTVRGHRKRGRPRMSTIRGGRGGVGRGGAVAVDTTGAPLPVASPTGVVKRGRGRPRLLPLGPGHQGQRPLQQLPAALGALQQRCDGDGQ